MTEIDDIKSLAQQLWPRADRIDVFPGASTNVSDTRIEAEGFTVTAWSKSSHIIDQLTRPGLNELAYELRCRLTANLNSNA